MGIFKKLGSIPQLAALSEKLQATVGAQNLGLPIAIDFGAGALKVLQLAEGNPPTLVAAASLESPPELHSDPRKRLEAQLAAVPKLIRQGGFKGKRVVCSIPAWATLCKQIQLPKSDPTSMAETVEALLPQQFNCEPGTLVHRFFEVGQEKSGKIELVVLATPRDVVERIVRGLSTCKYEPVGIHSELVAMLRAFDHLHRRDDDAQVNTLYLDIGASATNVAISHGRTLAFARVVAAGGRSMDEVIAKQSSCTLKEAMAKRLAASEGPSPVRRPGSVPVAAGAIGDAPHDRRGSGGIPAGLSDEVQALPRGEVGPKDVNLTEAVETITDEVSMCMRYHAAQFPGKKVDRLVFVGGEARHRGLCQEIARRLKLSAQMADPMARIARTGNEPSSGVDMKLPQPGWSVAVGLCLSPTDL